MSTILKRNLERDYGLALSWRFAEVQFLGLPKLKDDKVFRLEDIYVPLRLCQDWTKRFDPKESSYLPQVLHDQHHVVILGDPGSGKSTIVKVLTYAFGEAGSNAYKRACGDLIPIPIVLRDFAIRKWKTVTDLLTEFIDTLDEGIRNDITPDWLLNHLTKGTAILLIDGLDEVGGREERLRLRDEILFPILRQSKNSRVVLTSRVVGYEEVPFDSISTATTPSNQATDSAVTGEYPIVNRFYVAPFNDDEIGQFITRWYKLRETFPEKQREGVESLMRALNQNDRVKQLAHNPQLLTLVALIHRVTANLPSGRVELYDKIVEAYLETIQVYRKLGTPAKLDEMKRWLGTVGWRMQIRRDELLATSEGSDDLLISHEELTQWLIERIARDRSADEAPQLANGFLEYVAKRSGLLVPRGPEEFSFAHLTFQEYFAAFELRGRVRKFDELLRTCTELVGKPHWHETLSLLFEMLNEFSGACDDLVSSMLDSSVDPDTIAQFLSTLILDEQNGLSSAKQRAAIALVLSRACETGNHSLRNNLRSLPPSEFERSIREPMIRVLQNGKPQDLPARFFEVGETLLGDWPTHILEIISKRGTDSWSNDQIADMVSIAKAHREAIIWGARTLPLSDWLRPPPTTERNETTLIELTLPTVLALESHSPTNLLLAQLGIMLSASNAQLVRASFVNLLESASRVDTMGKGVFDLLTRFETIRTKVRSFWLWFFLLTPPDSSSEILSLLLSGPKYRFLSQSRLKQLIQFILAYQGKVTLPEVPNELLNIGSTATQLAWQTKAPSAWKVAVGRLKQMRSDDDWSRLQIDTYLITLCEGTPALCNELNVLLDKAVNESETFTFPPELRELVLSSGFIEEFAKIIRILFLHIPARPVLNAKWFSPNAPESKYLLSKPDELVSLLNKVIEERQSKATGADLPFNSSIL